VKKKYNHGNKKIEKKIIIFSGAGISAESGISTFRDSNGLWEKHRIEDICNQFTWKKNFELVHQFYNQRRLQLNNVTFNNAHEVVAKIQKKYGDDCHVITQNVDDLFERAGCTNVLHVHGELKYMNCEACGEHWEIGYKEFDVNISSCPKCGSVKGVRPDIVFFGGNAPNYKKMFKLFDAASNGSSIVIVVGTLGNVIPIEDILKGTPCMKILNNLDKSQYIDDKIFDKVYFEEATTALAKIETYIEQFWK
jgi:NAD-dependent deacetylase